MFHLSALLIFAVAAGSPVLKTSARDDRKPDDSAGARDFLEDYNRRASDVIYQSTEARWLHNTNLTDYNQRIKNQYALIESAFSNEAARNASRFNWQNFTDAQMKREFSKIADMGTAILPTRRINEMNRLSGNLTNTYNLARVCGRPGYRADRCFPFDPDLTEIMASSRDSKELLWAWKGWRDVTGAKMPDNYEKFVKIQNEAAVLNGYADQGEYWRSAYEVADLKTLCERLWIQVRPLYEQLHAYVSRRLRRFYQTQGLSFPSSGHIPAHILGNMWAQSWAGIESIVRPFPSRPGVDVTPEMKRQNYTVNRIFRLSEDFFTSLRLIPMPQEFWDKSMLEKPKDGRSVVCYASAWDFYNRKDYRIKQCTEIDNTWLLITHHEMGHVEYFLQYAHQPVKFRGGANPGFHEAIGDVMDLSVSTPEHLNLIGLLDKVPNDEESDINFLMNQALKKIAFLPFGYLIDQWRWEVFAGLPKQEYNSKWWEFKCRYQGVSPPTNRSTSDFDAGAKFHVPNNTPYIRYFWSHILQFQFHKSLCDASGNTRALHRCDIYGSTEAGKLIGDMMKMGSSQPWPEALLAISGTRQVSAQPLLEYFDPLMKFLTKENEDYKVGWDDQCSNL